MLDLHRFKDYSAKSCNHRRLRSYLLDRLTPVNFDPQTKALSASWVSYVCPECGDYLLRELDHGGENSPRLGNHRIITPEDMRVVELWAGDQLGVSNEQRKVLDSIGTTFNWRRMEGLVPCQVTLKSGEVFSHVDFLGKIAEPPCTNRNPEETSYRSHFWSDYAGIIIAKEIAKVEPSPFALSWEARDPQSYRPFECGMVERSHASCVNVKDKNGQMICVDTPPYHWFHQPGFDFASARPMPTTETTRKHTPGAYTGEIFALI